MWRGSWISCLSHFWSISFSPFYFLPKHCISCPPQISLPMIFLYLSLPLSFLVLSFSISLTHILSSSCLFWHFFSLSIFLLSLLLTLSLPSLDLSHTYQGSLTFPLCLTKLYTVNVFLTIDPWPLFSYSIYFRKIVNSFSAPMRCNSSPSCLSVL